MPGAAVLLAGCHIEPLDDTRAKATGTLAARVRTANIDDACVVEGALRCSDLVSADPGDLHAIAAAGQPQRTGHS